MSLLGASQQEKDVETSPSNEVGETELSTGQRFPFLNCNTVAEGKFSVKSPYKAP